MFNSVPIGMYFHCCHFLGLDILPQAHQPAGLLRLFRECVHKCGHPDCQICYSPSTFLFMPVPSLLDSDVRRQPLFFALADP